MLFMRFALICVYGVFRMCLEVFYEVLGKHFIYFPLGFTSFEVSMRCFGCVLRCRMRCVGKHFVYFSLGFISFEVFCPVWALYNIKGGRDTPPRAPSSPPGVAHNKASFCRIATSSIVPGARVPNGHTLVEKALLLYASFSLQEKLSFLLHGISILVPPKHPPTSVYISDSSP